VPYVAQGEVQGSNIGEFVGIPFTRDPTKTFFGGAGIGWTVVGAISAGPHLFRGVALAGGVAFGQTVGQGQSLASLTTGELRVGYFVR
jgi:hypothetical protein